MKIPKGFILLFERLQSWAEAASRILATYWLPLLSTFLILGSVVLKWVQVPFSRNFSGLKFSILRDPGIVPSLTPFSFGAIGLVVLFVGLILWRKNAVLLGLVASILLTIWVLVPAQIAFRQPSILRRLNSELEAGPMLNAFSRDHLAENYGSPESVPKRLVLHNAWGRFSAAVSFLRLGWYCFGLGALLLAIYALRRLPASRLSTALLLLVLPLGALAIVLFPAGVGQHYFTSGLLARAEGRNQEAISDFRKAMRWDRWHAQDIELYGAIGHLQELTGIDMNSPERSIRRALAFRALNEYEPALFELARAAEGKGQLAATAQRAAARFRIDYGLALYQAGGVGAAVANWELALAEDRTQIFALPYLARGYYDLGRYQAGIDTATRLARLIKGHRFVIANAYSMIADCYAKLGDDANARRFYARSLATDSVLNYWALTGLAGE